MLKQDFPKTEEEDSFKRKAFWQKSQFVILLMKCNCVLEIKFSPAGTFHPFVVKDVFVKAHDFSH